MNVNAIVPGVEYLLVNLEHNSWFKGRVGKSKYIKGGYLTGTDGNKRRCHLPLKNLDKWKLIRDTKL